MNKEPINKTFAYPVIHFKVDSITYNILDKTEIPVTEFSIFSEAGLEKVDIYLQKNDGDVSFNNSIEFDDTPNKYNFSQSINYDTNIIGFIVIATDINKNVSELTLPVIIRKDYPEILLTYKSTDNREFNVYTNVNDSIYAMFRIVHQKNEQQNKDLWRVMDSYFSIYNDGEMTKSYQILTPGENEFVWISSRTGVTEFTGGFHGNERIDRDNCFASFYLDSTEVDVSQSFNLKQGTSFYYRQISLMYETGIGGSITSPGYTPVINAPVECTHEKITTFADGGFSTYNKVKWAENAPPIKRMYYGIFCVTEDVSTYGYNDTGVSDPTIINFVNDGQMKLRSSNQRIIMYNNKNNISVECDGELLKGGPFALSTYVWDHSFYHKYYSSIENTLPIQTTKGEIWETTASIKFKMIKTENQ